MPRSQHTGDLIYNPEIEKEARRLAKEKRIECDQTSNPHEDPEVEIASSSDMEPDSSSDPRQEIPKTPPLQQNPPIIEPIAMADGGEVPERTWRQMMETDVTQTPTGINYPVFGRRLGVEVKFSPSPPNFSWIGE